MKKVVASKKANKSRNGEDTNERKHKEGKKKYVNADVSRMDLAEGVSYDKIW